MSARRVGDVSCFVAWCDNVRYGPFDTREEAAAWVEEFVESTGDPNLIYEWGVIPVARPSTAAPLAGGEHR